MTRPFARLFAWPSRRNGNAATDIPDANRLIRVPAMDARFRRICAVFAGGRCLIARGYEADARLRSALLALRQSGAIPVAVAEETATLEEIAVAWRAAGVASSPAAGEAAARRVKRLFEDAAAARASDVVFETSGGACHVFAIVNDRKLPLAQPLTAEEGREAAGFLFHCKDEGSSQTSYRRGSFQGFSIRAGGQVPLSAGVSALRCQRGPHEPDGDHLFARMFYSDRLDAARQVMQFIDTGHQVWTTIHVHSANAILFRLIDMGVGVAEVTKPGNVALLMKQTLLPLLCPDCALERHAEGRVAPDNLAACLRGNGAVRYRNPKGCPRCRREDGGAVAARAWNGYIEQTAIAETIRPDAGYLAFVRDRDPLGAWPTGARRWAAGRSAARSGNWCSRAPSIRSTPCSRAPAPSTRLRRASPWSRRRSDDGLVPLGRVLEAGIRRAGARAQGAGRLFPHRRRSAGIGLRARTRARRDGAGAARPGSVLSRPPAGRLAAGADREPFRRGDGGLRATRRGDDLPGLRAYRGRRPVRRRRPDTPSATSPK